MVFFVKIVEGKDLPNDRGNPDFEADYRATGGMIMRMKKSLFGTGKAVAMDSGFFVLKGLLGMLVHGVYGKMVIKKKDIGPSTAREIPLRHSSETRRLGVFMLFVLICMGTSTIYSVRKRLIMS